MGGVHGEGHPLSDQTEWVLDRIVELFPETRAGFEPAIAIQTITEAIRALEGTGGATLFGLAHSAIDPNKVQQMLVLLEDALTAWRDWCAIHDPAFEEIVEEALAMPRPGRLT